MQKSAEMNLKDGKDKDLWDMYETDGRARYKHTDLIDHLIPDTNSIITTTAAINGHLAGARCTNIPSQYTHVY